MATDKRQLYLERCTVLQTLRLTSLRLRAFAEAVDHRHLALIDDEIHEKITCRLAERLNNSSDEICRYVRDLSVVGFKGDDESYCLNVDLIVRCLHSVHKLDTFSWSCNAPLSAKILDILRQRFPYARLCASVNLIDTVLLSERLLYKLAISVPCAEVSGHDTISLIRLCKEALLQLASLRHLLINTHQDPSVGRFKGAARDSLHLLFEHGDRLPPLTSFDIVSTSYNLTGAHCERLFESIDRNKLQSLTLGTSNPIMFFAMFTGKLPGLTSLDVSCISIADDTRYLRCSEACSKFIGGLQSLNRLTVRCNSLDLRDILPKILTDVHGPSLLHLSLQAMQENFKGPSYRGNIRTFLWKFTNLCSLDMAFSDIQSYHRCPDCQGYEWGVSQTIEW